MLAVGDAEFQKKCLGKMKDVAGHGRTVLFVSHNMGAIKALCEKCILLQNGNLVEYGSVLDVAAVYQSVDNKVHEIIIEPSMRNKGNGKVVFNRCAMFSKEGEVSNSFLIQQDIKIVIDLDIKFSGKCYFWFMIFDMDGRSVLSAHQIDKELLEVTPGNFKLTFITEQIGLMPGSYTISAGAFDQSRTFLEWIDNCQSFEVLPAFVTGKAFDQRWGMVNQNAVWDLRSIY